MKNEKTFYVFGRIPIKEALEGDMQQVEKIFLRNNIEYHTISDIQKTADELGIPVSRVPAIKLEKLVGKENHQGIVAMVSPVRYLDFMDWLLDQTVEGSSCTLLLEGIHDPHNFGAVLRTAAAAGIYAVLVPKHGQSPITGTVMKTSAGTAGKIPIVRFNHIRQAITDLKSAGFYVVGMDAKGKQSFRDIDYKKPLVFVLGNEGEGIKGQTTSLCDELVYIPLKNEVESLNASVSAALICYEWERNS